MPASTIFHFVPTESHVDALSEAMAELKHKMNQVYSRICKAESDGRAFPYGARVWLREVDAIEDRVQKIVAAYTQVGCIRGLLVRVRAIKALGMVKELMNKGDFHLFEPKPLKSVLVGSSIAQEVEGMERYLEMVRGCLENDGVRAIGICGMGGVGKTTLMKIINNTILRESTEYDVVIWVEVSRDFNLKQLQREVARRLNLGLPEYASSQAHAAAIFSILEEKNFVLLMDDLWETVDLQAVGIPLPDHSVPQKKRKLILTTRYKDICSRMGANRTIELSCLDLESAWILFSKQAGEAVFSSHPVIAHHAKELVRGCGGLPLALVMLGQSMSSKHDVQDWQEEVTMMRRARYSHLSGMDHVFQSLQLGYDHLHSDTLRNCLLSCSLWPEGDEIEVDELIKCWMGMGLMGDLNEIDEAFFEGYTFVKILQSAFLLEGGEGSDEKHVKMHCLVWQLALWIASKRGKKEGRWVVGAAGHKLKEVPDVDRWRKSERVSLINNKLGSLPENLPACPNLMSLTLEGNYPLMSIPSTFFPSMPALLFLDLSKTNVQQLPPEIRILEKLRHLNLSQTPISSLPEELGDLQNLKYLHLTNTFGLAHIAPKLISRLSNLRLLDLYKSAYTQWAVGDTCDLEELNSLSNGLKALGITIPTVPLLQHLTTFTHLPLWRLSITGLEGHKSLYLSESHLCSLEDLCIEHCLNLEELTMESEVGESSTQNLHLSFTMLKRLQLFVLPKLKNIVWSHIDLRMLLPNLRFLEVEQCDGLKNISWVLKLRGIEEITLSNCKELEQVVEEEEIQLEGEFTPFLFLKKLRLRTLPRLHSICRTWTDFSSLLLLEVLECPELKNPTPKDIGMVSKWKLDTLLSSSANDSTEPIVVKPKLEDDKDGNNRLSSSSAISPDPDHSSQPDNQRGEEQEERGKKEKEMEMLLLPSILSPPADNDKDASDLLLSSGLSRLSSEADKQKDSIPDEAEESVAKKLPAELDGPSAVSAVMRVMHLVCDGKSGVIGTGCSNSHALERSQRTGCISIEDRYRYTFNIEGSIPIYLQ